MKMLIAAMFALLLVSGTAWAQLPPVGPDYVRVTNTGAVGNKVLLNTVFRYNPTPRFSVYAISSLGEFKVSGYRYINQVWTKVFPLFSTAVDDTAVLWVANMALPITQQIDVLCVTSQENGGSVDLVWYK
jgi:hypothetical protein